MSGPRATFRPTDADTMPPVAPEITAERRQRVQQVADTVDAEIRHAQADAERQARHDRRELESNR